MAKLFKRRDPNALTEGEKDFRDGLSIIAFWSAVLGPFALIATPIIIIKNNDFKKQQEQGRAKTEQVWQAGISDIELENGITKLKLDAVPSYGRTSDVLYIGRARYVDEVGRRCVAPIIGEDSGILIPEDNQPFPDISLVIEKEVCTP